MTVKVFDLLYLNGLSLIHKKTTVRKANLKACLKEKKGRIEFIIEFEGKTGKDVRQRMEDIMEARGEGLIIKHPAAEYVLNGRNKDWIKVGLSLLLCVLTDASSRRSSRNTW
jgi:DNA ligase-4